MCGTVAWLRKRRDDEQFDLAAWFPSLKHSRSRVAGFLYLPIFGQRKFCWIFHSRSCNEIHLCHQFPANLHFVVWMDNELRLTVRIDKALAIVVEIHLETIDGEMYQISIIND